MKNFLKKVYEYKSFIFGLFGIIWLLRLCFTKWSNLGSPWGDLNDPKSIILSWPLHKLVVLGTIILMLASFKTAKKQNKVSDEEFNKKLDYLLQKEENEELMPGDIGILYDDNTLNDTNPLNVKEEYTTNKAVFYLLLYIILGMATALIWIYVK